MCVRERLRCRAKKIKGGAVRLQVIMDSQLTGRISTAPLRGFLDRIVPEILALEAAGIVSFCVCGERVDKEDADERER